MRFPQAYVQRAYLPSGALALSGTVPSQIVGAAVDSGIVGTALAARVSATAFTNGLSLNFKWQVLDDNGSTWIDCIETWNPAYVALATGAGTSGVAAKVFLVSAPPAISAGSRMMRGVVYTSGSGPASASGYDFASVEYDVRQPVGVYGT
jgi:hypothetical protein